MRSGDTDALFEARVIELAERAEQYRSGYSVFFTPKEQIIAKSILAQRKCDCLCFFFGGYDGSERNRLFALPSYMGVSEKCDFSDIIENYGEIVSDAISAVKISGSGYRKLTHRDYLGSLLGLGIERGVIGDIVPLDDFSSVVFCDSRITEFILLELKKIGSDTVKTQMFEVPEGFSNAPRFELLLDTVASARFDCVISALTGLSREKAQNVIRIGDAELDYFTEDRADRSVSEGSVISVRGYGKFVVVGLSEHTKKGRLRLKANKYI